MSLELCDTPIPRLFNKTNHDSQGYPGATVIKIQNSKIRSEPLSADWPEQAQQLENKEVVDALDDLEHDELSRVNFAVKLIEEGNYGNCTTCENEISNSRLKAVPWASQCIKCAE